MISNSDYFGDISGRQFEHDMQVLSGFCYHGAGNSVLVGADAAGLVADPHTPL